MVLPEGTALPPLPILAALVVAAGGVAWLARRRSPALTPAVVLAFVPWMVAGAALHVLHRLGAAPPNVDPFLGTPAVYVTTFAVAGGIWLVADHVDRAIGILGGAGTVAAVLAVATVLAAGDRLHPGWPAVGLLAAAIIAAAAWGAVGRVRPDAVASTGAVGGLVVFAHTLDGVSTAIGVDVLGFGERTPLSRLILDAAGSLPIADAVGVGWLFVLVKVAVACVVVAVFDDYVREEPRAAYLLLGVVAAVGLGPAVNNLLLYVVR